MKKNYYLNSEGPFTLILLFFIIGSIHYFIYGYIYGIDILPEVISRNINSNDYCKGQQYRFLNWNIGATEINGLKFIGNNHIESNDFGVSITGEMISNTRTFEVNILNVFDSFINKIKVFISQLENILKSLNPMLILKKVSNSKSSVYSYEQNDYKECDINLLKLTKDQKELIYSIYDNLKKDQNIVNTAKKSNIIITPHFIYKYYAAVDWTVTYNGESFEKAIRDTINWRVDFKINDMDTSKIKHLLESNLTYISDKTDKHNRVILYFKAGYNIFKDTAENYIAGVMYTINRAEKETIVKGNGQFIVIVDLANMTFSKTPPMKFITTTISYLKKHYPYRLAGIYVLNTGGPFQFLWNVIKPLMPKKALGKTFVLSKKEAKKVLENNIGLNNLESSYIL